MDPTVATLYSPTYAILGLGLLAVGLLDHGLLAQATARRSTPSGSVTPDHAASRLRVSVAVGCLVTTGGYLWLAGWPHDASVLYMALYLGQSLMMVGYGVLYLSVIGISDFRAAQGEPARRREAKLLAQMVHLRGEPQPVEIEVPARVPDVPPFDVFGHFLLPFAVASGALVDVAIGGSGFPSLLALALAASHLRIAVRDWPARKYYLLGTLAASISAIHFMFVSHQPAIDWTVSFLILVSTAMLVEGLLDLRLARSGGEEHFSREHHADAI